jgi:amidase
MHRRDVLKWMGTTVTSAIVQALLPATATSQGAARSSGFNPAFGTAVETAAAIRRKQISARELLDITFQRINRHNPKLNAIIWQFREQAQARAKEADEALARGKPLGELHGLPVTIKEAFAYRGSPNTWGLMPLKDTRSVRTAIAVERLESAGAIVVGKTNVPLMLADYQTFNAIYGTTNNPWDLTRTPGGSTGGGAAALAAGLGYLELGSDIGGSIRVPAHFCGVYGHKPSLELISTAGHQPGPWDGAPGVPADLGVAGPLARSARDLVLAIEVLGGAHGDDARAWTWRLPTPRHKQLKDFRVGYVIDDRFAPVSSDVGAVYESALSSLSRAGVKLERGWPSGLDPQAQFRTYQYLLSATLNASASEEQRQDARQRFEKDPSDLSAAATIEPHALAGRNPASARFSRRLAEVFRNSRCVPASDRVHRCVPTRPQRAPVRACHRNFGRKKALRAEHPVLDLCCHTGRPSSHCGAGWSDERRFACWRPDRRTHVGGWDLHRVCGVDGGSCRGICAATRFLRILRSVSGLTRVAPDGRGLRP